jgi:hypothetical protein
MGEQADYLMDTLCEPLYDYNGPHHCAFCGAGGLQWSLQDNGTWRLVDKSGNIHGCMNYERKQSRSGWPAVLKFTNTLEEK